MRFVFDPRKAAINLRKHRVSFEEAITVFNDPFRSVLADDQHSGEEERLITVGQAATRRILFIVYTEMDEAIRIIGARKAEPANVNNMKKAAKPDPLAPRPDLDFSKGARGKYTNLLAEGTNIAVIEPELHKHFPDSASVNQALRAFLDAQERLNSASPQRVRAA